MMGLNFNWNWIILSAVLCEACFGAKLERKQDFFDVENYKREYGLNEIGKRGFTSTLGYDYGSSSEYGGSTNVGSSEYNNIRSGSGTGNLSPARDLIPPPAPAVYASSTSPPTTTSSEYPKFSSISSSPTTGKQYHSQYRSLISRRNPYHQQSSSSHFVDEINTAAATNRGGAFNPASFGLVADGKGQLIGYRGSILPGGYRESPPSIISSSASVTPDPTNFIGSYFTGSSAEYSKSKLGAPSSSPSHRYHTSTPVYYPGREEDNTYRMRDSTSQSYPDDEEGNPSAENSDFSIGNGGYSSPHSSTPSHHYDSEGPLGGQSHVDLDNNRYSPYGREHPGSGYSYASHGHNHNPRTSYDYNRKRILGTSGIQSSNYDLHGHTSLDRNLPSPYSYNGLNFNDYGSS